MAEPLSILLVEDDPAYAGFVSQIVAGSGTPIRLTHAPSLTAALADTEKSYDAVLLDLGLPDATGVQAIERFRQHAPAVPVVVLTANGDPELASLALKVGAQDFVVKGDVEPENLIRSLRYAIERWRAHEQARESERRYRYLFENSPLAMWVYDVDSLRFLAVNDAAIRAYGYTREEFMDMTVLDVRLETEEDHFRRLLAVTPTERRSTVARHRRKDGSLLDARITSHEVDFFPFSSGANGHRARLVLAEDVTERLQAERRMRFLAEAGSALESFSIATSLDRVVSLGAATISDMAVIILVDEDGAVEQVHFGHGDDEILDSLVALKADLRSGRLPLPSIYADVMAENRTRIFHDIPAGELSRFVTPSGQAAMRNPVRSVMMVPLRSRGRVFGALSFLSVLDGRLFGDGDRVVAEDLANRIVMTLENARLLRDARELFDADLTANFIATADGSLVACNETFAALLKFPDAESTWRTNAAEIFGGPLEWQAFAREVEVQQGIRQREMELRARDGSSVYVLASAVGLFDEEHRLMRVRGQCYDLTAHKQLEFRFSQLQKFEAIGRLAGGIAHDFNNLLTLIGGRVERLQNGLAPDHPLRRSVDEVASAGERAAGLTQQLLAFSRRQVLKPRVISLNEVVDGVYGMLKRLLGEHVAFELALSPDVAAVRADPGRLEQALMNLAINARDAMPKGGVLSVSTANVQIDEAYARQHVGADPGPYVRLAISDSGTGMDRETRERVFEPFFTTKEVGKGTGLGLSTVYGTVKQSGGHIWVYSELGMGTTFKIYLPAVDAEIDAAEVRPVQVEVPHGSETILLVEDEDGVRDLIEEVLHSRGYRVLAASRGVEALQIAELVDGPIDLLVTDVVMPHMSGREVVMHLAPGRPEMRVLYLSGYTDDLILHHGVLEPGTAFLQKPFGAAELARRVHEVLALPHRGMH